MAETATTFGDLAGTDKKAITVLRKIVNGIADKFSIVRESASAVAPRVMKEFKRLQAKHDDLDFVGFARLFDASIPTHAADRDGVEGYRKHKVYYTLDYMRRLTMKRRGGQQGKKDPAVDQLARTIATILQFVKDPDPVWEAMTKEFAFSARMVARLKTRVENAKPLIDVSSRIKPISLDGAKVIHMTPQAKRSDEGDREDAPGGVVMPAAQAAVPAKRKPGRPRKQATAA